MPVEQEKEGRLSRWSKRKLAVAEEEKAEELAPVELVDDKALAEQEEQLLANREAAEAVDLDAVDEETDFTIFMKEGVPDLLKRKAMATLWRSNPILANVDGLVDYDDDFANPDLIMKTFKSAYQAGRGYLEHVEREAEKKAAAGALAEKGSESPSEESADVVADEPDTEDDVEVAEDLEATTGEQAEEVAEMEAVEVLEPVETAESIEADEVFFDDPAPKVSLRKRLELEHGV